RLACRPLLQADYSVDRLAHARVSVAVQRRCRQAQCQGPGDHHLRAMARVVAGELSLLRRLPALADPWPGREGKGPEVMNPAINQRGTTSRAQVLTTIGFTLLILVPSLLGFAKKFCEFILLYRGDVDGVFAITPIMNYLLASLGFFCLFFWAIYHGMFRDIEAPKYTMLENERKLDEED